MVRYSEGFKLPAVPRRQEFSDRQTYEKNIIEKATMFTAVLCTAPAVYWRNEATTLDEAKGHANRMIELTKTRKHVMIYAVAPPHEVYVGSMVPETGWKERQP